MDTVVSSVGLGLQSQLLVAVEYGTSNGSNGGGRGVRGTQNFGAEIPPRKRVSGPRDGVPLDLLTRVAISCG